MESDQTCEEPAILRGIIGDCTVNVKFVFRFWLPGLCLNVPFGVVALPCGRLGSVLWHTWPCATCGGGIPTVVDHSGACRVVAHDCHFPVAFGGILHRAFGALHFFVRLILLAVNMSE